VNLLDSLWGASGRSMGGLVDVYASLVHNFWCGYIAWWDSLLDLCNVGLGLLLMVDALARIWDVI
jgi:hypothetical protein